MIFCGFFFYDDAYCIVINVKLLKNQHERKKMKMDRNEKTYHIFKSYKKQWFNLTPTIEER